MNPPSSLGPSPFTLPSCPQIDRNSDGLISFSEMMIAMRAVELDREGAAKVETGTFTRSDTAAR